LTEARLHGLRPAVAAQVVDERLRVGREMGRALDALSEDALPVAVQNDDGLAALEARLPVVVVGDPAVAGEEDRLGGHDAADLVVRLSRSPSGREPLNTTTAPAAPTGVSPGDGRGGRCPCGGKIATMRAVISAKVSVPLRLPSARTSIQSMNAPSGAGRSTQPSKYGLTLTNVPRRYL
jgi:hypothetical protein